MLYLPDDRATCAFIKILWDYHCGQHDIPKKLTKVSKPGWERTPTQEKIRKMSKGI